MPNLVRRDSVKSRKRSSRQQEMDGGACRAKTPIGKGDDLLGPKGLSIIPALRMRGQAEPGNDFLDVQLFIHLRIIFLCFPRTSGK